MWLRDGIIRHWVFVPCNSENISCRTFLKHKNSKKHELALWHLVNRLVPENAKYCIKLHIKHVVIQTKQAWSVKNYRYDCNVSLVLLIKKGIGLSLKRAFILLQFTFSILVYLQSTNPNTTTTIILFCLVHRLLEK